CSAKDEEYNKPAIYWYNKMIKQIETYQIDAADDTFTSLESEHRNSPLIPSAIMIIANVHMENEEYAMANFYYDEYLKRYSLKQDVEYIEFLKIKSNFMAFQNQFREQDLLIDTLKEIQKFVDKYPDSQYIYLVKTIKSRLLMTKSLFDTEIAELYGRIEKPKAKKMYEDKASATWEDKKNIKDIDVPWYRWLFE
ncbi:MAG: outer membrane protein assembly factor BamD, partial [Campylobacterota bacterium]|nr:outer membrane protein assembly factor BamD [Campylobacterota bacterium]